MVAQGAAGPWPHLLVQQLYRRHGPREGGAVRQRGAVRSTVGNGEGHALHGAAAAAWGDEAERHDGGRDEAGREIRRVGGQ